MKSQLKTLFAIGSFLWFTGGAYGQTEIKFWLNSSLAANEKNAYQKAAEEFGQKNPKLKVNVEVVPGSETDVAKLMTAVRSGAGPDRRRSLYHCATRGDGLAGRLNTADQEGRQRSEPGILGGPLA